MKHLREFIKLLFPDMDENVSDGALIAGVVVLVVIIILVGILSL